VRLVQTSLLPDELGQAPPGVAGPNVPAAQVNVPAAGQLGQAPRVDVPEAGPDVPVQPGNDPAHPLMVLDSSSPGNDPALAQMLPDPLHNGPRQSKTNLLPGVFARHPTVGPQVSHFPNHQPVSGFYLLPYEIEIGALYISKKNTCI